MSDFYPLECVCGNRLTVRKSEVLRKPSGRFTCGGLQGDGTKCGRMFRCDEIGFAIDHGEKVFVMRPQPEADEPLAQKADELGNGQPSEKVTHFKVITQLEGV